VLHFVHPTQDGIVMGSITFDTHEFIKDLQTKGFKPEQAEGISDALKKTFTVAEIATKSDIERLNFQIQAQISPLKWMAGASVAGILSLILKTFAG
jgi:hypothetical protein